jgi:hypothetical protein
VTFHSCPFNSYWNGQICAILSVSCPGGSNWNGTYCLPTSSLCPNGTYLSGSQCILFPQQCPLNLSWNGTACSSSNIAVNCPQDQYFNGSICLTIPSCLNGQIFNLTLKMCACSTNSSWNGRACVNCSQGQVYTSFGCICPKGSYLINNICIYVQLPICNGIPYSYWDG